MVQAIVNFGEYQDRILTIVKWKYGFKNKSQAVNFVIEKFQEKFLGSEVRPEYLDKLNRIRKGKYLRFNSVEELRRSTG